MEIGLEIKRDIVYKDIKKKGLDRIRDQETFYIKTLRKRIKSLTKVYTLVSYRLDEIVQVRYFKKRL